MGINTSSPLQRGLVDEVLRTKQKPDEAREIRTIVTYGEDGQKNVTVFKANLSRDSGRIRTER